jgi:ribosome-binding protein aMBF1 (putative translation factor)
MARTRTSACELCGAVFQGEPSRVNAAITLHNKAVHSGPDDAPRPHSVNDLVSIVSARTYSRMHPEDVTLGCIWRSKTEREPEAILRQSTE